MDITEIIKITTNFNRVSIKELEHYSLEKIRKHKWFKPYALSCFSYTLCGLLLLFFNSHITNTIPWFWWKIEYSMKSP